LSDTLVPLKRLAHLNPETLGEDTEPGRAFRYIDIATTGRGKLVAEPLPMTFETAPSRARRVLRTGDTILSTVRTYLRAVWTLQDRDDDLVASTGFVCLRPLPGVDPRFLGWLAQSDAVVEAVVARSVGVSYPAVNPSDVGLIKAPCPSRAVQRAIADYLDRETARIDTLIGAKRRMVHLLEERWQVVMHAAAAGHLSSPTTRRATTIPWLSSVPEHWSEGLLKLVARLGSGHTPSRGRPEWWLEATIPWVTTGEVAQMRSDAIEYITDTRERISDLGLANSAATLHPAGTVVLCRTASAGYSAIMGCDKATSQDFATWTCGPLIRPRFLLICLRAMRQDLLGRLAMGSTHQTIYMPDIESIKVPLPPVDEQDAIVANAQARRVALDTTSTRLRGQIALLVERRHALITAAVTGQLDLGGAA
jgi:type I restriction enzyme S subunit